MSRVALTDPNDFPTSSRSPPQSLPMFSPALQTSHKLSGDSELPPATSELEVLLVTPSLGLSSLASRRIPMSGSVCREEGLPTQHHRDRSSRRCSVPMVPKQGVCLEIRPSDWIQRWRLTWLAILTILMFSVFPMRSGGTGIGSQFSSRTGMSSLSSSITGINSQGGSSIRSAILTSIPPNPSRSSPAEEDSTELSPQQQCQGHSTHDAPSELKTRKSS